MQTHRRGMATAEEEQRSFGDKFWGKQIVEAELVRAALLTCLPHRRTWLDALLLVVYSIVWQPTCAGARWRLQPRWRGMQSARCGLRQS